MVEYRIPLALYREPAIGRGFIPLDHAQKMIDKGFKLTPIYDPLPGQRGGGNGKIVGYSIDGSFAVYNSGDGQDKVFTQSNDGSPLSLRDRYDCPMDEDEPYEKPPYAGRP